MNRRLQLKVVVTGKSRRKSRRKVNSNGIPLRGMPINKYMVRVNSRILRVNYAVNS